MSLHQISAEHGYKYTYNCAKYTQNMLVLSDSQNQSNLICLENNSKFVSLCLTSQARFLTEDAAKALTILLPVTFPTSANEHYKALLPLDTNHLRAIHMQSTLSAIQQ